jgi:hypothetical protein
MSRPVRRPLPDAARHLLTFLLRDRAVQLEVFNRLRAAEGFEGRALLTEISARAEDRGLRERLDRHAADEARHERLFEDLVVSLGGTPRPVPAATFIAEFDRLAERSRHLDRVEGDREGAITDLLAALLVIERKAVLAMTVLKSALPLGHPGRLTLASVLADEARHVAWVTEELDRRAATGQRDRVERALLRFEAIGTAAECAVRPALLPGTRRRRRLAAVERIGETLDPDERDGYLVRQRRRIRLEAPRRSSPAWTLLWLRLFPVRS